MPEEHGGAVADFRYGANVVEEFSRAGCGAVSFRLHSEIISPYLVDHGAEEQKCLWPPRLVKGETITTAAMAEPSDGSEQQTIRTRAERDGEVDVVNGQKTFVRAIGSV